MDKVCAVDSHTSHLLLDFGMRSWTGVWECCLKVRPDEQLDERRGASLVEGLLYSDVGPSTWNQVVGRGGRNRFVFAPSI
jgi:hypothetical protein